MVVIYSAVEEGVSKKKTNTFLTYLSHVQHQAYTGCEGKYNRIIKFLWACC